MPSEPLSRSLIEVARDLRERRVSARELVEAAIARHERFGERLHGYSFWAPEEARTVADAADAAFAAGVSAGPLQGCRSRSRTCLPPPAILASPDQAGACRPILGNGMDRWSRRCAASWASSRARPIWSNSRSAAPARTAITGRRTTHGM